MPKYASEKLTSWTTQGYMEFEHYSGFQERYNRIPLEKDKNLATFLFFTGASPKEAIELRRDDVSNDDHKIKFRIRKIGKDNKERQIHFVEWVLKYPELQSFWLWVKQLPDDFYIFSWLRLPGSGGGNPRDYIKKHIGDSAYFFRHNINSLLAMGGATDLQLREFKGAKSDMGIAPYKHLSKENRSKLTRLMPKAIE